MLNSSIAQAYEAAERSFVSKNTKSEQAFKRAQPYLPGGNSRSTVHYSPFPLCIKSASGGSVTDLDDHRYVDLVNEHTAALFGHSNSKIAAAVRRTIDNGYVLGGPCLEEQELAEILVKRFPALKKVRFCNSGTEANVLAIGTAMAFTKRSAVMIFAGGYHGSVLQFVPGAGGLNVPFEVVGSVYNDCERACADIRANAERLAAVIVEPMQGGAGAIAGTAEFLTTLSLECSRLGIVLIFDEVMTSRLSPTGLHGQLGLKPDLITLGKYIGGGLTLGAFGGRDDIMNQFDPTGRAPIFHGGTFNNNVLAMAAGIAAFREVASEVAIVAMNDLGDDFRKRANALAADRGLPVTVSGIGSIFGLHFHEGPIKNSFDLSVDPATAADLAKLKAVFQFDMFEHGFYVTRRILGNLSLETTNSDVESFLECLKEFFLLRGSLIRMVVASKS